ncbi:predicted protein [Naegleria gruberi]|uniref:Predicted protein n=1 Tax=Naegleria gruberi TaxID=5762 RepID=D2VCG5_NAEGR|nr:uncharacterized protein NAEGRDRAFT_66563 [Naegleria gruberi]EFC45304.1 predicted protein [Naegleria gruberi]|eukprot:XP_002678048.1 predicted protein [Naegleria gruberi strain NEG-M]
MIKTLSFILLVLLSLYSIISFIRAQERFINVKYSIKTLIGTGAGIFNLDGLTGLATNINSPIGVFYEESSGDLNFSHTLNNTCVCKDGFYGLDCSLPICLKAENGKCANDTTGVTVENIETSQLSNKSISLSSGNLTESSVVSVSFPSDFSHYISNQTTFSSVSLLTAVSTSGNNLTNSNSAFSIVSNIITISLALTNGKKIPVSNLENPIQISFQKPTSYSGNLTCMYLDELTNEWKSDGVKTVIEPLTVNCLTSHLTSFSVIDINLRKEIGKPKESPSVSNQTISQSQLSQEAIIAISVSIAGSFIVCCVVAIILSAVICLIRRKSKK